MPNPLERALAALALLAASPLLVLLSLIIVMDSPGAPWFVQTRVGRYGGRFGILKLRTMHHGAEQRGGALTVAGDDRITRVGGWLRATKLDELPQLVNVVRGDMALVGPRPEVPGYVALYDARQRRVLRVKPGLTDPASLRYRNESALLASASDPEWTYRNVVMPDKLALNLAYLDRRTTWSDLGALFATVVEVVRPSPHPTRPQEAERVRGALPASPAVGERSTTSQG